MPYRSQRSGVGIGRGGVFALAVGALIIGTVIWLGPLTAPPAELRLLALSQDGEFSPHIVAAAQPPDPIAAAADAVARAPLILAVQNVGARPTQPSVLRISVPGRYRLTGPDGDPLPARPDAGSPLTQYEFELDFPTLRPHEMPTILPGLDTLWIEAVLPQFHCDLIADAVPEFIPAPPYDAATLASVRLFYTLDADTRDRQSGLLTVDLDPSLLRRTDAVAPQRARVTMHPLSAPRPELGPLSQVGTRTAACGDPGHAIELHTILWEGEAGGLLYEVQVRNESRKLLYDLNRDGRVDLEIWDAEGDGGFRARREASYPVPSFLRPLPERMALAHAEEPVDSLWLARFVAVQEGPYRFADEGPRTGFDEPAARPAPSPAAVAAEPVDSAWLARFHDPDAGPFRFAAAPPVVAPPAAAPPVTTPTPPPAQPTPAPPPPVAADTPAPTPPPAAPSPRAPPRLLGEPVPWPPRPDTTNLR
jgi:hypothetical protein